MTNVNLPIGASNSGSNDWADVHNEDQAIVDVVNGGITNGNLSGSAGITDANLASPNNSAYRTIFSAASNAIDSQGAATYLLGRSLLTTSGADHIGGTGVGSIPIFYFDDAYYTVAGKTLKIRVAATMAVNAAAPARTYTVGLYPVTCTGLGDAFTYNAGTVVSGTTVAFASPSSLTIASGVSTDATVPSDGAHALGVVVSGAPTADFAGSISAHVQVRAV